MKAERHCWRCGSGFVAEINPGVRREDVGHPGCPATTSLGTGVALAALILTVICACAFYAGRAHGQEDRPWWQKEPAPAAGEPVPQIVCAPGQTDDFICLDGKPVKLEITMKPGDGQAGDIPWLPANGMPAPGQPPPAHADAPVTTPRCPPTASFPPPGSCHYTRGDSPDPDPKCTPGQFDPTLTAAELCSEGQSRRCKDNPAVAESYGVLLEELDGGLLWVWEDHGEDDHYIPLCAGGTNDPPNRWQQPAPDFHDKDLVEAEACRRICLPDGDPRQLTPEAARAMIYDWRAQVGPLKSAQAGKKHRKKARR